MSSPIQQFKVHVSHFISPQLLVLYEKCRQSITVGEIASVATPLTRHYRMVSRIASNCLKNVPDNHGSIIFQMWAYVMIDDAL